MFHRTRQGAIDIVSGAEPLTAEFIELARESFLSCLGEGQPKVIFDMQEVALLNSLGMEMLLDIKDACDERAGVLKLAAPTQLVGDILEATGLSEAFEVYPDLKSAVGSFLQ